jgi:tetratricopeptide (TPR) repeat protein
VLRAGVERFPEDREFPLYLGETLVAIGQHREAVEVLATESGRQQKSARYQLVMARAHLGSGQQSEAIAAFLRSAEADEGANHLNTVAWELGDRGLALDDALRLAQQSVSASIQEINRAQATTMGAEDLRGVRSLAMTWDTLGWIHFKRGDSKAAIPYLEAAWQLAYDPVIARHLVSAYQQVGNDSAVARYTSLAAAGGPLILIRGNAVSTPAPNTAASDARNAIDRMLIVALPAGVTQPAAVDVVLLVATDGRVLDTRFVGAPAGPLANALHSLVIPWMAPDAQLTQLVRRGTVSCDPHGACTLRLWTSGAAEAGLPW